MTLGSLFDGAGTFPFAASAFGILPIWASEIEPFPIQVTQKRLPKMKHLGDITKIDGSAITPVDVITFGSPCQDLSVAGKRAGLDGERSGLFLEAIRIIKEMRRKTNGKYPRYAVWENVPGAFSSNKGEDFRTVLEEFCKIKDDTTIIPRPAEKGKWRTAGLILADGYSIAWRVLDAQFWGIPQRRRRIFLVADFGGGSAGEILFEQDGLQRSFAESRKSWRGITTDTTYGSYLAGRNNGSGIDGNGNTPPIIPIENHPADSRVTLCKEETIQTLTSRMGTGGGNTPLLLIGVDTYNQTLTGNVTKTLLAGHIDPDGVPCVAINMLQDAVPNESVTPCLSTGNPKTGQANVAICYQEVVGSLCARDWKGVGNQYVKEDKLIVEKVPKSRFVVRRVIPVECARLQGMPDWWCKDIKRTDSAEYKMWGNGMALPCVLYVMQGIAKHLRKSLLEVMK